MGSRIINNIPDGQLGDEDSEWVDAEERNAVATHRGLRLIKARTEIEARVWGEQFPLGFCHSFLTSVNLPYRDPGVRYHQRTVGDVTLTLKAGSVGTVERGLPYGARARLVFMMLCTEAVRNNCPQVEIKDSFTRFARNLGMSVNGRQLRQIREQMNRLAVVHLELSKRGSNRPEDHVNQYLFRRFRVATPEDHKQRSFWTSEVEFSQEFYNSIKAHSVPLDMKAVAAVGHSARALDVLVWLTARLWRIHPSRPTKLKWTTLRNQFGHPGQDMKGFKRRFKEAVKQVLYVYPAARVDIVDGGLELHHSPPMVPMRSKKLLGGYL